MSPTGKTVHEFIISGDINRARSMLEENTSLVTQKDLNGRLPLHWASSVGSVELVEYILDLFSNLPDIVGLINAFDETNWTPLIIAASAGKTDIVRLLLGKDADVNAKNINGHSALQYAASKNHVEIVELLIAHQADPNITDEMNSTPLHRAASLGNSKIVSILLEKCNRIQINSKDNVGNTPLHLACEEDRLKEAEILIYHGASKDVQNKAKKTPLDLASPATAKILNQIIAKSS